MSLPPYDDPSYRAPPHPLVRRPNGARKFIGLLAAVLMLGLGWTGLWFYAAGIAEDAVAGWQQREAKAGRFHSCGTDDIGGFPFRIEMHCAQAQSAWRSLTPPLTLRTSEIHAAAQIYQPTLLIAEIEGPLTAGETGRPPFLTANWKIAQMSLRGTPSLPERVSLVLDQPILTSVGGATPELLAQAARMELHGRIAEGSARDNPVIETVLRLMDASLPAVHELAAVPMTSETVTVLRGLKDFSPKPWADRFREIQAAGGSIEIKQARVEQGDMLAVGGGTLSLNASGRLEGQMRLTVVGLDQFLKRIGIENSAPVDRLAGSLDRLMPGLGAIARSQAGAGVMAGVNLIGEQTTLEGRKAVAVPLRFVDGAMMLGPLPLGQAPALF